MFEILITLFIAIPIAIFIIYFAFRNVIIEKQKAQTDNESQNGTQSQSKPQTKGFFQKLLDDLSNDFGVTKETQKDNYKPFRKPGKTVKDQPIKKPKIQEDDFEHLTFTAVAPPMTIEPEDEATDNSKSDLAEMIEQDEDILKKMVIGDLIMTPKIKKRDYRKLF